MPRKRNTARTNRKRTKLLQNLSKGMNKWEAGRAAGYGTPASTYRALKQMQLYLPDLLERIDMPAIKVLSLLKEMTLAKKTIHFQNEGIVTETREVEDNAIRLKAREDFAAIYNMFPRNGHDNDPAGTRPERVTLNVVLTDPATAERLMGLVSSLSANRERPVLDATPHQNEG